MWASIASIALGVMLRRADPAAVGRAQHHRAGQPAAGAVAQPRGVVGELIDCRIDEAHELDLGHRLQPLRRQADRDAGDPGLPPAACHAPFPRRTGR